MFLHYADLSDDASLRRIFSKTKPDEFYHLAGQSHVGISFEIPEVTTQEIANCTLKLLEICRDQDKPPKVYLACSSEIFGNSSDSAQNENSPLILHLPMGWLKPSACTRVIFTGNLINYLSVMVSPTTTNLHVVAKTLLPKKLFVGQHLLPKESQNYLELGNLDIERDWGYAPDYVLGMWLMLQQKTPSDYVLATGTPHKLSEFLEMAFQYFDLDYQKYKSG